MRSTLLPLLLTLIFAWGTAKANEAEPNDTRSQANVLALNGSNSGIISTGSDQDWWKVTTNGDGKLAVTLQGLSGHYMSIFIYDNDGTTNLAYADYLNPGGTLAVDGLAQGTYYIKVASTLGDPSSYNISNTLTLTGVTNDAEPDSTRAEALALPLNGSLTGHVGYYYNNHRDSVDWYKVATNADGQLSVTLNVTGSQYMSVYLYDGNGTNILNSADYLLPQATITKAGLAPGTYYVKVFCTYSSGWDTYTLSNSLLTTGVTNDTEPDSTRGQALALPLNSSKTGHVGYYFNNYRDTLDWYKVTTTQDGELDLTITSNTNTGNHYISMYLYDNDGTSVLNSADYVSPSGTIKTDKLAAGTYYVKVFCTYNSEFNTYVIKDSLIKTGITNDAEPNGSKNQALILPLNGSVTGHVGYYFNHLSDSADWYKVTTTQDGALDLTITANTGSHYLSMYLYDNNGTTVLNSANYILPSNTFRTDGLAVGTYYVKVFCTYSSDWDTYTLRDTLLTYANANDAEPNGRPYLAKTMLSNASTPGHVGFYYNNLKDTFDWHKINYTGTGNLALTLNLEGNISGIPYFSLYVYKDTNAVPVFSANYQTASANTYNLTGLSQGYYYIKVFPTDFNSTFGAYSIGSSFAESVKAKITLVSSDTAGDCSNTNLITFKCAKSNPPYAVQLFRYGLAYGNPVTINNTRAFSFSNLPLGVYYATAKGDGANISGKSVTITLIPMPANPVTTNIASTQAKLNWTPASCVSYYNVQYRKPGDASWTTKKTKGNVSSLVIRNLTPATTYVWHVAAADSANNVTGFSVYTDSVSFTTSAAFVNATNEDDVSFTAQNKRGTQLTVYPNPARTQFTLRLDGRTNALVTLTLKDLAGRTVWSASGIRANDLTTRIVDVSNLTNGMYLLQVIGLNNTALASQKIIVER